MVAVIALENSTLLDCVSACEDGPVENLQVLIAFIAFCLGVSVTRQPNPAWARAFFAIGTAGALYIALEEVRYGQGFFGWATPENWGLINDQNETNLHNTSSWFDQKPRLLLEIGVLTGGIIIPALQRWAPEKLPKKFSIVYPCSALTVTACMAIGMHAYDSLVDVLGRQDLLLFKRTSEIQEAYLFWFILLYFLYKRRDFLTSKEYAH